MKTLIRNAYVLTMDEKGTIFENGCVLVEGEEIVYAGEEKGLSDSRADREIDADRNIVMPGFINAHTHLPMTIFKGYGEGLPLKRWLEEKIWPAEAKLNDEMVYWTSMLGLIEMARTGTTSFLDMYMHYDSVFDAVDKGGYRCMFSRAVLDVDGNEEVRLKEAVEAYEKYHGKGNVEVMMSAHAEYTCSPSILEKITEAAEKYDTGIHIHISESRQEHMDSIGRHGLTPIQFFDKLGVTKRPIAAAHCVHVNEKDMEIIAEKNISVLSCPQSNLKLGSGISPIKHMLDMGINVAVGTDGSSSNNNLDMIEETMLISLLQRGVLNDAEAIGNMQALKLATAGGAKALGWSEKLGSLKSGYFADLIMIDTSGVEFVPRNDLVSGIINSGCGRDVCMTMIGGKIVYESDSVSFADEDEVKRKVQEFADKICS